MGDMFIGPQADVGRYLSTNPVDHGISAATWQPIGYNSSQFPLSRGLSSGLPELRNQIGLHPGPFLISCWSLGAIITTVWYEQAMAGGPQHERLADFKGCTTFGNPYRQQDNWAPRSGVGAVTNPGGAGIGGPRNNLGEGTNPPTPDWWHNYAHPGDMYTACPVSEVGDDIRIVFDFILTQWQGAESDLFAFARDAVKGPLSESFAVLGAIVDAISFYAGGCRQHVNYDARSMGALNFMAGIAKGLQVG